MIKKLIVTLFSFSFLISLSGCGQTGPLYLPDHPSAKSNTPD
ncbi:MAG: lipoprotein [Gammaproteobacteria bacterium]|nr:lipoprotein [Gammaproteobacteria bacterium]